MNYEKILYQYLSTCDGIIRNVFFNLYTIVETLEKKEQPAAVKYICENAFKIESDNSYRIDKEYYTKEQAQKAELKISQKFTPTLNSLITDCSQKQVPVIEFYEKAWLLIQSSVLKTKRERALALFRLVSHELIPYRSVGIGITMENEEYKSIVASLGNDLLNDMEYILRLDYEQRTQRASLLVDRLLSLNSKQSQAVYMAILLDAIEDKVKDEIKSTLQEI